MKWQAKLNPRQRKHLKGTGATTLVQIQELRTAQKVMASRCGTREVCWECRSIATTLGIETKEG